jgi:hypothetical protein
MDLGPPKPLDLSLPARPPFGPPKKRKAKKPSMKEPPHTQKEGSQYSGKGYHKLTDDLPAANDQTGEEAVEPANIHKAKIFKLPAIVETSTSSHGTFWSQTTPVKFFVKTGGTSPLFGLQLYDKRSELSVKGELHWGLNKLSSCKVTLFDTRKTEDAAITDDVYEVVSKMSLSDKEGFNIESPENEFALVDLKTKPGPEPSNRPSWFPNNDADDSPASGLEKAKLQSATSLPEDSPAHKIKELCMKEDNIKLWVAYQLHSNYRDADIQEFATSINSQ